MGVHNYTEKYRGRFIFLVILLFICTAIIVGRLFNMQINEGDEYARRAERRVVRNINVSAPRGEILDRYGRPLVTNRMGFNVVLNKAFLPEESQNDIILKLLELIDKKNLTFTDSLPVTNYPFEFLKSDNEEENSKILSQIEKLYKYLNIEANTSAAETMAALFKKYGLEEYEPETARIIAGVRYEMDNRAFSVTNPFTFAADVDTRIVTTLKERYLDFPGVDVETDTVREYTTPGLASHILGRVGSIYKDEADYYLKQGYQLNELVGKDGIEKTMESYLRGISGIKAVEKTNKGNTTTSEIIKEATPGNNVILTIDKKLQEVAEKSLDATIKKIASRGRARGADANAGAVVVIDVRNGDILAMASNPTYDLSTFNADYASLLQNPDKPLVNRAISGTYEPGSTFKMATALAGLQEGAITTKTIVNCTGRYDYYAPQIFRCWIYTDYGRGHGRVDVRKAIQESCNCFFYETGRLTGIDALNQWATKLGLGQKTGVELIGESAGILAGPSYREKKGLRWYAGDTLQAAIGQSDNLFTPIQIANYVATLVNGGDRYKPHLVKAIKSYHMDTTIIDTQPEVIQKVEMDDNIHKAIMNGMRSVAEEGTAASIFRKYPIAVGGKTGTASVSKGTANGVFVAFAPFENPEIAVAVVIEHGASGGNSAPVARDIFDVYFANKENKNNDLIPENQLLQ